jgi:CIC family chloride channel protein
MDRASTHEEALRGLEDTRSIEGGRLSGALAGWLDRLQLPQEVVLIITSLLVGTGTGLMAVVLHESINAVGDFSFKWLPEHIGGSFWLYILLMPTLGGLLLGAVIYRMTKDAMGHGVSEVMEAIALRGGRIPPIVTVAKTVASSITIGSGGSAGPEGPIVQIGASIGSTVGQVLRLSDDRIRNLVACGAGGGIAAIFNAPISGVMFALEVILGELGVSYVGSVVIAAVAASTVTRAALGAGANLPSPHPYTLQSGWEYIFYALLGVASALVAVVHVRSLYWADDFFHHQKRLPDWAKPAIGGLLLGAMTLLYPLALPVLKYGTTIPQVYSDGYPVIIQALSSQPATHDVLVTLVALVFLKLIATNFTLGSGGSGGVFAPSLFVGAVLGGAVGVIVNRVFPGITAPSGAYALVGMAAVLAGSAHAPITAIVLVFELTGDYRLILPLMISVVVATLMARSMLDGESIYTLKLTRKGIRLQSGRDVDVLQSVTVSEIMSDRMYTISDDLTLVELSELFSRTRHHGFPVLNDAGKLVGIVTASDLEQAIARNMARSATVAEFCTPRKRLLVAFGDEPMGAALARLGTRGLGRLPVVSREDPDKLIGLVRREDMIRAYNLALTRRAELQHRAKRMRLRNIDGTEFVEVRLAEGDTAVGKKVQDIAAIMPRECILVSIRRNSKMLIPHGSTTFQPGDIITAFVRAEDVDKLYNCLQGEDGTVAARAKAH